MLIGNFANILSEKMNCIVKKYIIPGLKAHSMYDNITHILIFVAITCALIKSEYSGLAFAIVSLIWMLDMLYCIRKGNNLIYLTIYIVVYLLIVLDYWFWGITAYINVVFINRAVESPKIEIISWYMFFVVYVATYGLVYSIEEKIKDNDIIFGLLKKIIWGIFSLWIIGHTLFAFGLLDDVFFLDKECRFGQYEDIIKYMYLGLTNMNIAQYAETYNAIQMKEIDTKIIPAWLFIVQYACSSVGLMCLKDVPKYNEKREVHGISRSIQMCKKEISTFMSIIFCKVICRFINYVRRKTR